MGHTPHGENYAFLDLSKKIGIHICAEFAAEVPLKVPLNMPLKVPLKYSCYPAAIMPP